MTLKRTCSKNSIALAMIAALGTATAAHAQKTFSTTVVQPFTTAAGSFSTTTTASSPTFDRPAIARGGVTNPTGLSGLGKAVAYATTVYTPTQTGIYTVSDNLSGYGNDGTASDYVQSLYTPTFSPTAGITNIVQSYNPPATSGGSYNINLTAGSNYTFVDHGYYNASDFAANPAHGPSFGNATTSLLFNNPGSQTTIPDASSTTQGQAGAPASQKLTVSDTTIITSFDGITVVGLQHPALGDLTATLSHNGVTVDLFDHTGATSTDPHASGNTGQGSQASFNSNNTYTFSLSGADLSAVPSPTGLQPSDAPSGTYKATGNAQGGFDTANVGNSLASFIGQSVSGDWVLTMTDHQPDDAGSFLGFSFTVNTPAAAPEPSQYASFAVGLLGLGGLAVRARSRRRAQQNA